MKNSENKINNIEKMFVAVNANNPAYYVESYRNEKLNFAVESARLRNFMNIVPSDVVNGEIITLKSTETDKKTIVGSYVVKKDNEFVVMSITDSGYDAYEKFYYNSELINKMN